MKRKKISSMDMPPIIIDDSLAKYKDMPIFQESLNRVNEILRTVGMPDEKLIAKQAKAQKLLKAKKKSSGKKVA